MIFSAMLEQYYPDIKRFCQDRFSIGIILASWWFTCIIINAAFKSTLLSTVINPASLEPEKLEDLVNADFDFAADIQLTDIITFTFLQSDPIYRKTLDHLSYTEDVCVAFNDIVNGDRLAIFGERTYIQYELRASCQVPSNNEFINSLRTGRKEVLSTGHALAIQMGAPFRIAFDHVISIIFAGGHFQKWTKDYLPHKLQMLTFPMSRERKDSSTSRFTLKRFCPIITIYLVGMLVSVICFLIEVLGSKKCKQRMNK